MSRAVSDARGEDIGNRASHRRIESFVNDVPAERQRQSVVLALPPVAEIGAALEAFVAIGELTFVNDEADVGNAIADGLEDLIERHDDELKFLR
jgi:hypothetical protein